MSGRPAGGRAARVKRASGGRKESSDRVGLKFDAIKDASARDFGIRFAFGAGVSVVAGLVGIRFGPRIGGIFLAFPAILPAALTLLQKKDGEGAADADAQGGILGALGLLSFALAVAFLVRGLGAPLTLLLALAAWVVVSSGLYFTLRAAWPSAWR
ncbi:MAG: DUF3147 family protein [Candidatus Dormibacteria bacterium]